jgi:hypothetical protein
MSACNSVTQREESKRAESASSFWIAYADKIEYEIFLIYKEIQMGSVAKSYKVLISEKMRKYLTIIMRRPLVI